MHAAAMTSAEHTMTHAESTSASKDNPLPMSTAAAPKKTPTPASMMPCHCGGKEMKEVHPSAGKNGLPCNQEMRRTHRIEEFERPVAARTEGHGAVDTALSGLRTKGGNGYLLPRVSHTLPESRIKRVNYYKALSTIFSYFPLSPPPPPPAPCWRTRPCERYALLLVREPCSGPVI